LQLLRLLTLQMVLVLLLLLLLLLLELASYHLQQNSICSPGPA